MGLDISWHRKLTRVGDLRHDDDEDWSDDFLMTKHDNEFGRANDIPIGRYSEEEGDSFRAGSYGGYNEWRDQLAALAGFPAVSHPSMGKSHAAAAWEGSATPTASTLPFYELINFSDCEGVIGTAVCAKLASDFATHQSKTDAHDDKYFREKYALWRNAFEKASDGGCVDFH